VEKEYEKAKLNILIVMVIMALMTTFCFVFYTGVVNKNDLEVNTNLEFLGGSDTLSKRLQETIPYVTLIDKNIKTAYQNTITNINSIDNDVYLTKAYNYTQSTDIGQMMKILSNLYGSSLFIVHKNFYVNGIDKCIYNDELQNYECQTSNYKEKIYHTLRTVENLIIENDTYYLSENIIFYSIETINNIKHYTVYKDYKYEEEIDDFTNLDLEKENIKFDVFIKEKYKNNINKYRSKFSLENVNYIWNYTERIV